MAGRAESHASARRWKRCAPLDLDVTIARQAFLPTLTVDAVYGIEANAFALHSAVAAAQRNRPAAEPRLLCHRQLEHSGLGLGRAAQQGAAKRNSSTNRPRST